jgi:8-oxo-dGTP diphosphatase
VTPVLWVGAVIVEEGRLLLVRQGAPPDAGRWTIPSTELAGDEALAAGVVRAVLEATGLEAVCERLVGVVEDLAPDHHRVVLVFGATVLDAGVLKPAASWVAVDEVTDRPLAEGLPELLADCGILRLIA